MKNIHIVPTPKPSLVAMLPGKELTYSKTKQLFTPTVDWKTQNIHITNDEEIKEGDWCFSLCDDESYEEFYHCRDVELVDEEDKKIILTTDQDLIKDGVQPIPDEFLEWFVKNPSCEFVEVDEERVLWEDSSITHYKWIPIIPKEEPKERLKKILGKKHPKQETLEDKLKSLVEEWRKRQEHYIEIADKNLDHEHTYRKFTYKAMATRDCWKELLKLIEDGK